MDALPPNFLAPPNDPRHLGRLGPYDVLKRNGRGGMGVVFKAFDSKLKRLVAIKVMAPEISRQDSARKSFFAGSPRRRRRLSRKCRHHPRRQERGLPYAVMQYVAGGSLEEKLVARGTLPLPDLLRRHPDGIRPGGGALRGLVHRDMPKPANILLGYRLSALGHRPEEESRDLSLSGRWPRADSR